MVNQLARHSLIPLTIFNVEPGEQNPYPSRDAGPQPDTNEPGTSLTDEANAAESERSWIDDLAAALRKLARQDPDSEPEQEPPDELAE